MHFELKIWTKLIRKNNCYCIISDLKNKSSELHSL